MSCGSIYVKDKALAERYNVHRKTIWEWVRAGRFPRPIKLTPGCARWPLADVEAHERERREAA